MHEILESEIDKWKLFVGRGKDQQRNISRGFVITITVCNSTAATYSYSTKDKARVQVERGKYKKK